MHAEQLGGNMERHIRRHEKEPKKDKMDPDDHDAIELHNSLYECGSDLLFPYFDCGDAKDASSSEAQKEVRRGCEMLERVIEMNPQNWNAMWILGMGRKVLNAKEAAYDAFKRAFEIEQENPDVAREFAGICVELGRGVEAVQVAYFATQLAPDDAGLLANLGLALLINGELDAAIEVVDRSLEMDPGDSITKQLRGLLASIQAGETPVPSKWPPD